MIRHIKTFLHRMLFLTMHWTILVMLKEMPFGFNICQINFIDFIQFTPVFSPLSKLGHLRFLYIATFDSPSLSFYRGGISCCLLCLLPIKVEKSGRGNKSRTKRCNGQQEANVKQSYYTFACGI